MRRLEAWLFAPQPVERLALVRVLAPLVILGFLSTRFIHADAWISTDSFLVPRSPIPDWRQPLFIPALPHWGAWAVAALTVLSGLALCSGFLTRVAAASFAAATAFLALADRLEAFTVSKLAPMIALALFFGPSGAGYSVDSWRQKEPPVTHISGGAVRFFQLFLVVMYSGSGIAKARGDWFSRPVLFTHLHDSYQTAFTYFLVGVVPAWVWSTLQLGTLTLEAGAPLWFALPWTRRPAFYAALSMHILIGLMFGPVIWFALLMSVLLIASYGPERWLVRRGQDH
jgi:hypothetical protein